MDERPVRLPAYVFAAPYGDVYEVHSAKIDNVVEKSPFYGYQYLSGILVTPPDSGFTSDPQ